MWAFGSVVPCSKVPRHCCEGAEQPLWYDPPRNCSFVGFLETSFVAPQDNSVEDLNELWITLQKHSIQLNNKDTFITPNRQNNEPRSDCHEIKYRKYFGGGVRRKNPPLASNCNMIQCCFPGKCAWKCHEWEPKQEKGTVCVWGGGEGGGAVSGPSVWNEVVKHAEFSDLLYILRSPWFILHLCCLLTFITLYLHKQM